MSKLKDIKAGDEFIVTDKTLVGLNRKDRRTKVISFFNYDPLAHPNMQINGKLIPCSPNIEIKIIGHKNIHFVNNTKKKNDNEDNK